MGTEKQNLASTRNWAKRRLLGFNLDTKILTKEEKIMYANALSALKHLRDNWDKNTEIVLDTKLRPYKCSWCGKRSSKEHLVDIEKGESRNFCNKCLVRFLEV